MKRILLLGTFVFFVSCSPVRYFTITEGGHDPLFDIKSVKTIGFTPFCINGRCDELTEKQFFIYARNELQERGYEVYFIPKEYMEYIETENGLEVHVKESYENMPDLTLTVLFDQGLGNVVHVPGQSVGSLNWGNQYGGGYYGETQGYDVQTYFMEWEATIYGQSLGWDFKKGKPQTKFV